VFFLKVGKNAGFGGRGKFVNIMGEKYEIICGN
jgi:hypothetical protein